MCRYPHSAQPASHTLTISNALKDVFEKAFIVSLFRKESTKIDYIVRKRT